ncbi:MAG TPA: hypothetical protein VF192_00705 [Longimicrobiales bacterium]
MSGSEWLVVIGAFGAIAWVNWYFFVAPRRAPAATAANAAAGGVQEVTVGAQGGDELRGRTTVEERGA